MMKPLVFLFLLVHGVSAVTHSMTYILTAASGLNGFPEYTEVGLVDGQEFVHYNSHMKKIVPKTAWIEKNEGADYWERETQRNINTQQVFKQNVATVMGRLNQTGGIHIVQNMYGCEWDDETDEVNGYHQYGYDGEDFISFNLETESWIAPKPEAVITKHKWDNNKAYNTYWKNYHTQTCPEWIKKYVNYGRSSLMRKDLPSVSLLQKTPSSPVSCHATGFYPDRAMMFWRKDGEEIHEGVEQGEILPNPDGSFQMNVDLDVSSASDWTKYDCVFQLSGVKDDIITKLDEASIKTNWGKPKGKSDDGEFPPTVATAVGVVVALLLLAACIAGIIIWRRNNNGFKRANTSDTSSSSAERPDPEKENDPDV